MARSSGTGGAGVKEDVDVHRDLVPRGGRGGGRVGDDVFEERGHVPTALP